MKSIFILGASRLQVPAIKKRKKRECMSTLWTMIQMRLAFPLADKF